MAMCFSAPNKVFNALGADTSNQTSPVWFTGDFARVTCSVITGAAAASRISLIASDADGFTASLSAADPNVQTISWSHLTQITGPGVFSINTIPRWIMAVRATANSGQTASNITVTLTGSY